MGVDAWLGTSSSLSGGRRWCLLGGALDVGFAGVFMLLSELIVMSLSASGVQLLVALTVRIQISGLWGRW